MNTNTHAHIPRPGIHLGDYLACEKLTHGEWIIFAHKGEIHSTKTGKPVPFWKNSEGYLYTTVRYKGITTTVLKHRAVFVMANVRFGLPIDASLEVDHINHDKEDCRIENLRLVTRAENEQSKPNRVPPNIVREIRKRYAAGGITQKELGRELGIPRGTVSRIVRYKRYARVKDENEVHIKETKNVS